MFSCCSLVQIIISAVGEREQKLFPSALTSVVLTATIPGNFVGINICVRRIRDKIYHTERKNF